MRKKHILLKQYLLMLFMYSFLFALMCVFVLKLECLESSQGLLLLGSTTLLPYWIACGFYIITMTLLSTSYIGFIGVNLSITLRFLGIIHSLTMIEYDVNHIALVVLNLMMQFILEVAITYVMSFMSLTLSKQTFMLVFVKSHNYSMKPLVNYCLNYYLLTILLIFLSSLLKIYQFTS